MTGAALALTLALAAAPGRISGTVGFTGRAPRPAKLKLSDPACPVKEAADPAWRLSADGKAVVGVLVRLTRAPPGPIPAEPVVLTQVGCLFSPWVQGAVRGQRLTVKNADPTMHGTHAWLGLEPTAKTAFNVVQPPGAPDFTRPLNTPGIVRLSCDVHPWKSAFVVVSEHPYFTVTGDEGAFELREVPPGSYTVEAWHEKLGTLTAEVKVDEGQSADPKFTFSRK